MFGWTSYLCPREDKALFVTNTEFQIEMMTASTSTFSWKEFLDSALLVLNIIFYQSVMMLARAIACMFKFIGMRQQTLTTFSNRAKIRKQLNVNKPFKRSHLFNLFLEQENSNKCGCNN